MSSKPKNPGGDTPLADELFRAVELEQGRAFISDGLGVFDEKQVVAIARGSLIHTKRVVVALELFLKKHGHITKKTYISSR